MANQEHDQSLELPPTAEALQQPATAIPAYEQGQSHETQTAPSGGAPTQYQTVQTVPVPPLPAVQPASAPAAASSPPIKADDADLIEKEWVSKAKEIVARTHGDPYQQNKEINKIKADYIKKRYNKDIKQSAD